MDLGGIKITRGSAATPWVDDRTDWSSREIRGSEKKAVFGLWAGGVAPLLFGALGLWWTKMPIFIGKNIPNPFLGIIALFSLISFARAIWETIRLKRFGDPTLELNTLPILLGGTLEGRINLSSGMDTAPEFTITLACIHRVVTGNGKNNSTRETILWSGNSKASLLLGGILPISIAVPADQPQTNGANPFDRILWLLTVKAPFPGPSFLEKYEVPVGQPPVDPEKEL